jgi:hypothetical protein
VSCTEPVALFVVEQLALGRVVVGRDYAIRASLQQRCQSGAVVAVSAVWAAGAQASIVASARTAASPSGRAAASGVVRPGFLAVGEPLQRASATTVVSLVQWQSA